MPFRTPPPAVNKSRIADLDAYVAQGKQLRKDLVTLERQFLELQAVMKHEGTLPKRLWKPFKELTDDER